MAPKATAGRVAASIYMDEAEWRTVRAHAVQEGTSASALVTVLIRRHLAAAPDAQANVLEEARQLGRRRSD